MHLNKIFIDRVKLDYGNFETTEERQQYHERLAEELYFKHLRAIKIVMEEPEFYVLANSKMNAGIISLDWKDIILKYGSEDAKRRSSVLSNKLLQQGEYGSPILKPAKQKTIKAAAPIAVPERLERPKARYSNVQWSEINEQDLEESN